MSSPLVLALGEALPLDSAVASTAEQHGLRLRSAQPGEDPAALVDSLNPLATLLDLGKDAERGLALLRELRRRDPRCPVIVVGDVGGVDLAIDVLRAGALDYLQRPIAGAPLGLALERARERRLGEAKGGRASILVLDDHEPTCRQLARALERAGHRVAESYDGLEGLELLGRRHFDLLLADLGMPAPDGLEVLRTVQARGLDIEVIVVTGFGDDETVVEAMRAGAINFIRKPIDIDHLLLAVDKALEYLRLRRSVRARDRDVALLRDLALSLGHRLQLVVEAPPQPSTAALDFLQRLVDALPFGVVVADAERHIVFANHQARASSPQTDQRIDGRWLAELGLGPAHEGALLEAFDRAARARSGRLVRLELGEWSFLVLTPVELRSGAQSQRFVVIAWRPGRRAEAAPSPEGRAEDSA